MTATRYWRTARGRLDLERPLVMGIVNVTPDSFSDGGAFLETDAAFAHGCRLWEAGADILDVGGESTRPGADPVDADTEIKRVGPVVERLVRAGALVSIDTRKPTVAAAALEAGAATVNDVGGLSEPGMLDVLARSGAGVVIMHMQGNPATMQLDPTYTDVVSEVAAFLEERAATARRAGLASESIVIDPGIGFGKTTAHNLTLLAGLPRLVELGYPLLVGASRKSFLGELTGRTNPADRDLASAVTVALAIERGAKVVRVHDVAGTVDAVTVTRAIVHAGSDADLFHRRHPIHTE